MSSDERTGQRVLGPALGAALQVRTVPHGDRLGHEVFLAEAPELPLLVSVEQGESENWPPSPPLQSCDVQAQSGGEVALLVGMAGQSHWSASIEVAQSGLIFDIACRMPAAGDGYSLGSTYRMPSDLQVAQVSRTAEQNVLELKLPTGKLLQLLLPDAPPAKTLCKVDVEQGKLEICPTPLGSQPPGEFPCTVRWKYELRLVS